MYYLQEELARARAPELVGRIGILNPLEWPGHEIAYTIGKRWWGRGLATEGALAVRDWFAETGTTPGAFDIVTVGPHARRSWLAYRAAFGSTAVVPRAPNRTERPNGLS